MGVRILESTDGYKCLYDSVTMTAFGPIFYEKHDVLDFLEWLTVDARTLTSEQLADKQVEYDEFQEEEVSDCCCALPRGNGDNDSKDYGICPDCGDHCSYIQRKEAI